MTGVSIFGRSLSHYITLNLSRCTI